jgi:hypothetical protein
MNLRKYRVHLLTFATAEFSGAQRRLVDSALRTGKIDHCFTVSRNDILGTSFYRAFKQILDAPIGAGYFAWKPYLISEKLAEVENGDFVIYCDCGRGSGFRFLRSVDPLLEWTDTLGEGAMPGVSIPQYGSNAKWTKRDCFVYMDCDKERFWQHPQIQATHSVWKKTRATTEFVNTWLRYCCDSRVVTDAPNTCGLSNLPGFVAHRRDQSVLTNLVIASRRPFMDGSAGLLGRLYPPQGPLAGFLKNPNNIILLARGWSASRIYGMTVLCRRFPRLFPALMDHRFVPLD